jgi:hypothetical protein
LSTGSSSPITERSALLHTVLVCLSCGLWTLPWFILIGMDLRRISGGAEPRPWVDLALCLITCGIWGIWVVLRWSRLLNAARQRLGLEPDPQLETVSLILAIFTAFFHYTNWQLQLNQVAQAQRATCPDPR